MLTFERLLLWPLLLVANPVETFDFRQSAELNKLRQDYARLMNELGEKSSKLQQEELQKKNAEQAVAQLKVPGVFSACQVVLRVLSEPGREACGNRLSCLFQMV